MMRIDRRTALKSLALAGGLPQLARATSLSESIETSAPSSLSAATNQLGWELFRSLGAGNLFLSPASIALALAMTERGARGATREEMRKVLHLPSEQTESGSGWSQLVGALQAEKPGRQVRIANRLFGQKGYGFSQAFLKDLADGFQAPLEELDYASNPEACRARINEWVADQTRKMIKDLIPTGVLQPSTRLVLANAIHFKGDWLLPFSKSSTMLATFEVAKGESKKVERMRQKKRFVVRENDKAMVLEMPCKGGDRSVHFLLPKTRHGLAEVESALNLETLQTLLFAKKDAEEVGVGVPRFKVEVAKTLNGALSQLGMPTAFTDKADFSGMNDSKEPLKIDLILHKAVLAVDELGAEAAAATAVLMAPTSVPARPPREFLVDQPFLVAIVDKPTESILFLGRVSDPSKF